VVYLQQIIRFLASLATPPSGRDATRSFFNRSHDTQNHFVPRLSWRSGGLRLGSLKPTNAILCKLSLFPFPVLTIMPSQHGATLWVTKETKRLARMSAEIVKDAIPQKSTAASPALADSPIVSDIIIPDALQKGTTMTKISEEGKQKSVLFRLDPDEGRIMYKSSKGGIGM
jgi:hypothetical protein